MTPNYGMRRNRRGGRGNLPIISEEFTLSGMACLCAARPGRMARG
ncbi:hypothetical protein [Prochlorococcus marinus]|nr:hypothetical protein [Prochlorococcus marinus]